jgi:HK97 family phage prohead protease
MKSSPDTERSIIPVEWKFVSEPNSDDGGTVEGYASVFLSRHESGDRVMPGAFRKTIKERVKAGMVPYLDSHQWDAAHTVGTVTDASEDSKGLQYRAKLSKAPSAQDLRLKMIEGHIKRNSIGFMPVRESYEPYDPETGETFDSKTKSKSAMMGRSIHEIKLYEISAVPLADDPNATIQQVKSAVPFQDLSLASRDRAWDASAARSRVESWAGGEKVNFARYRRAFLWYDRAKPDEIGSYKLPIADVIDGELTAIPRAIFAAAAAVQGARGGAELDGDEEAVKAHLNRYYEKMAREFNDDSIVAPWNKKSIDVLLANASVGVYEMSDISAAAREFFAVIKPEDRAAVLKHLAEIPAGPATPPTETTAQFDSAALDALRERSLKMNAELLRRRVA